jgi:hypothetical protein
MTPAALLTAVRARSGQQEWRWLEASLAAVATEPATIRSRFPAVGRKVGRGPAFDHADEPADVHAWTVDDAARTLLLVALGEHVGEEFEGLYWHGDVPERRAVLRALAFLPVGNTGVGLVLDALRTNDTRLVAAALGPYAAGHLGDHDYAHGVLKCAFLGVPLTGVAGLPARCTSELARMLAGYAHERVAAGRDVPPDIWPLVDRHPPAQLLAVLTAELDHPVAERRAAARRALDARAAQRSSDADLRPPHPHELTDHRRL